MQILRHILTGVAIVRLTEYILHKKQFGFHPYASEMAKLVREGYLERSIALERINKTEDKEIVTLVQRRLNRGLLSSG